MAAPTPNPPAATGRCPGAVAGPTSDGGILAVKYPGERAIVQRDANNQGTVYVSLKVAAGITCVDISTSTLSGDKTATGVGVPWQMLQGQKLTLNDDGSSTIEGSFVQPAGGWYQLKFATWKAQAPTDPVPSQATFAVSRLGVGELFLVAGQSNSTNCGSAEMTAYAPDDHVSAGSNETNMYPAARGVVPRWVTGTSPMPGPDDGCIWGTPWSWAGSLLVQDLQVPVGFVLIGSGGTSTSQWLPQATSLYDRLVGVAQLFSPLTGGFRAVLWHQGESDAAAGVLAADYQANMKTIIDSFRQTAANQWPWLIARASWLPGLTGSSMAPIEAAQDLLRADQAHQLYPGSSTDDMSSCNSAAGDGGYRDCRSGNGAHFSYLGLTEHGRRWHDAILALGGLPAAFNAAAHMEVAGSPVAKLAFPDTPRSFPTSTCGLVNLVALSSIGAAAAPTSNLSVGLSSSRATFYNDAGCAAAATATTIYAGTAATALYVKASDPGAVAITAAATGVAAATTTINFNNASALRIVEPPAAIQSRGACVPLHGTIVDGSGAPTPQLTSTSIELRVASNQPGSTGSFYSNAQCSTAAGNTFVLSAATTTFTLYFRATTADTFNLFFIASGITTTSESIQFQ